MQIYHLVWNPEVYYHGHKVHKFSQTLHLSFLCIPCNIIITSIIKSTLWTLPLRFSWLKLCLNFSSQTCMLHLHLISPSSIHSPYKLSNTCNFLSSLWVQILSSACCCWTVTHYIRPSEWETKFHTSTKQQVRL